MVSPRQILWKFLALSTLSESKCMIYLKKKKKYLRLAFRGEDARSLRALLCPLPWSRGPKKTNYSTYSVNVQGLSLSVAGWRRNKSIKGKIVSFSLFKGFQLIDNLLQFEMRVCLHSIQLLIIGVVWVAGDAMAETSRTDEEHKILDSLAEGSNKFAIALYRAVSQKATSNVVVSPISLQLVLALAYCGAKGKTASEISRVLGLSSDLKDVKIGHKLLIEDLQQPSLKIANKMFLEDSFEILEDFQLTAKNFFLSVAQNCDFMQNPEKCRKIINSWVEDNTDNKIKDLLASGVIDSNTKLVLTNAVHFKADWKFQFLERLTKKEPFHVTPTQEVTVDMMHIEKRLNFKHSTLLGAKILELPYRNGEFRMIVILPNAIDGLSDVEDKLVNINLAQEISNLDEAFVNVTLPKFKLEETMDMNPILKAMGITTMFETGADFSGISGRGHLMVSQVTQKAFIDVNEKGTEAAAATGFVIALASAPIPRKPEDFKADHPFLMLLTKCGKGNHVLFISRYSNPE